MRDPLTRVGGLARDKDEALGDPFSGRQMQRYYWRATTDGDGELGIAKREEDGLMALPL